MPKPIGHKPKFDAFTTRFPDATTAMVFAQFGLRGPHGQRIEDALRDLQALLSSSAGPIHVDRTINVSTGANYEHVVLAYWDNEGTYEEWWTAPDVASWWDRTDEDDSLEYWRAVSIIPLTRFESLHSAEANDNGVSHFVPIELTETHEYWGGMRDRIADSKHDALRPAGRHSSVIRSAGRVLFTNTENLCLIRTAQDWSRCVGEERVVYRGDVEPTLRRAVDFLATSESTAGCLSATYLQELAEGGLAPTDRTCIVAWWRSLGDLEEWTVHHPTHKAIFASFYRLLDAADNGDSDLHLWHEVSVMPEGAVTFEYVNCEPPRAMLDGQMAET